MAELRHQLDTIMNSNQSYKFQFLKKAEHLMGQLVDIYNQREIQDCEVSDFKILSLMV